MAAKKIITFFSLFFLTVLCLVYMNARRENRNDYQFVVTKVFEDGKGNIGVNSIDNEFGFSSFNSYKIDIEKGDSLAKKRFSKNVYIYRKDKKNDKYLLFLTLHESGIFPIDWQ